MKPRSWVRLWRLMVYSRVTTSWRAERCLRVCNVSKVTRVVQRLTVDYETTDSFLKRRWGDGGKSLRSMRNTIPPASHPKALRTDISQTVVLKAMSHAPHPPKVSFQRFRPAALRSPVPFLVPSLHPFSSTSCRLGPWTRETNLGGGRLGHCQQQVISTWTVPPWDSP